MRQIKFRGIKDGTKADWAYGGFHSPFEDVTQIIESVRGNASQMTLVYEHTVGQFTGLKDKNGVDIYEGDIVKKTIELEGGLVNNFIVFYGEAGFDIKKIKPTEGVDTMYLKQYWKHSYEVIGNIYEI